MAIFDNLKNSLKQWLLADEEIHSTDATSLKDMTIHDEYALYDAWAISDSNILENVYKQLPASYNNHFWKAVPDKPLPKKTTGLASIMVSSLINIISENYNGILFNEREDELDDIWTRIEIENNFYKTLMQAIRDALVFGEGAFKILYLPEISDLPIITFVSAKKCESKYVYNRVKEIEFYDNIYTDAKGKKYTLHEIYKHGSIEYHLYNENDKEVPLSTINETANLEDVYFSDENFIAAVPYHIYDSDKRMNHGESIFANGKTDLLDFLDENISQYNLTVRLSAPKLYPNDDMFERDPETGKRKITSTIFNPLYIKHNSNVLESEDTIQVIQNAVNSDQYGDTVSQLVTLICAGIISPSTLAIQVNSTTIFNADSGESQREKEKQTLYTINKIKASIFDIVPEVIINVLKMYGLIYNKTFDIDKNEISVEFSEYANPSFEAQIQTLKVACPELTIMTPEEIVAEKYGYTITDEERAKMIRSLYIINYGVENIEQLLHKNDDLIESQVVDSVADPEDIQEVEDAE